MHKFWCCGRPLRSAAGHIQEDGNVPVQIGKVPQVLRQEPGGLAQSGEGLSWFAEAAIFTCTSLTEVATKGSSASSWPSRLQSLLQTINHTLCTSNARLALFARIPHGTATCVMPAISQGQLGSERPPAAAMGWSRTALYDRLTKYQLQDDTVTIINRHYDSQNGPDVTSLSSHCYSTAHGGGSGGLPASASSFLPKNPLQLQAGDLLAVPIIRQGRVVAALLLGWGAEGPGAGGNDRVQRPSGAGRVPSGTHHVNNHLNNGHHNNQGKRQQQATMSVGGGAAAAAVSNGSGYMTLGPSDLRELRRLAQLVGFGLLSDPQQAAYLEQVAALIAEIGHGAATGLHDVMASVLDAIPALLQTRLSLPLQPLLAAVLGNSVPAVVFVRRQGNGGILQSNISGCSIPGGGGAVHTPRSGAQVANGGPATLNGAAGGKAPLGLGSLGYGSVVGGESRSGSRKYLGRETSMHSLAAGTLGMLRSGDLVGCDIGSGTAGPAGGCGVDGGGCDGGGGVVNRVKAVRTALAYTLLQRVLRAGSYTVCGTEDVLEVPLQAGPFITSLVVPNASSQVLEEEQPGRDVLLAANLTGGCVACLVLCAEAPYTMHPLGPGAQYAGGGAAWSSQGGHAWASANGTVATSAATPGLEVPWGCLGGGSISRLSRCGTSTAEGGGGGGGGGAHDVALEAGGSRNFGLAMAAASAARAGVSVGAGGELLAPHLPGGVSCGDGVGGIGGCGVNYGYGSMQVAMGGTLPFRLALYLVSSDPAPGTVLEAVAEEMKGLLPLIFGAMHAAISAGGAATGDFCALQAQLLQRTTTSGTLDLPTPLTAALAPNTERRGAPLALLPQPHLHNHQSSHLQPNSSIPRSPGSAAPKSPRTGSGGTNSPSAIRRGSIGGVGSASRLRLASPGVLQLPGGGG
ncbi:hypothetical protein Vretifemale_169, partial [Volvox reticuliferus]